VRPEPDVGFIRMRSGLTQADFAKSIGVRLATLQQWETRRRKPTGPARALLLIVAMNPAAYVDAVRRWNGEPAIAQ
jgi:putative transcriptional regulator